MERAVFDATIEDLEKVTTTLTEDQKAVYWEHLKKWPPGWLKKAVTILLQTYRAKRFPSIPVFRRVLDHVEVRENAPSPEQIRNALDDLPCPACNNTGWQIESRKDGYDVAVFCPCDRGRKRKEGVTAYFKMTRRAEEKKRERAEEPPEQFYAEEDK